MNLPVLLGGVAMITFWGVWGVTSKVAVERIGMQALLWGQIATMFLFPAYFFLFKDMLPLKWDAAGIGLGIVTGVLGTLGTITLLLTLRTAPSSIVVPLSSLYPIVTVILAFIFLREELTPNRVLGIACAMTAVWLLTKE